MLIAYHTSSHMEKQNAKATSRGRGCISCKKRKVLCDRTQPSCLRCVKKGVECPGYAFKLSWPRNDNTARGAVVDEKFKPVIFASSPRHFVNTSLQDVAIHNASILSGQDIWYRGKRIEDWRFRSVPRPVEMRWTPLKFSESQNKLIQAFQLRSHTTLRSLDGNNHDLRDTILQMAMSSASPAAVALLLAILALTLLHLHGPTSTAVEHQLAALQTMQDSTKQDLSEMELCQLVAAGLLIAQFEDRLIASSYGNWVISICSTKLLMDTSPTLQKLEGDSSMKTLLDWMHYTFVIKTFTLMNWPRHELPHCCYPDPTYPCRPLDHSVKFIRPLDPCYRVLNLLSDIFQTVVFPHHPVFKTAEYHDKLAVLEQQVLATSTSTPDGSERLSSSTISASQTPINALTEMYKCAALIYLERFARNDMEDTLKIRLLADQAFQLLDTASSFDQPFLLFIFGCEAYSDARRVQVLDLIEGLQDTDRASELERVRAMLNFVWGQDDLGTKWESHISKIEKAFRLCDSVPSFT